MPVTFQTNGVSDIIRSAEKQISAGNFRRANELLTSARANEPSNEYIAAIQERIFTLGQSGEVPMSPPPASSQPPGEPQPTPEEIQKQVRRLVADARGLFQRGAYQSAFETLTKAYLLDPVSADVLQAESLIVPAFERMRAQAPSPAPENGRPSASQVIREHLAAGSGSDPQAGADQAGGDKGGFFARLRKGFPLRP